MQQHASVNVIPSGYSTAQDILQSTGYNALGQVISQTVPYAAPAYVSNGTSPYTTVNLSSAAKTLTNYDGAGRVKQVIGTDGATTNHYYGVDNNGGNYNYQFTNTNMWQHSVADPNGHQFHTITDGFGRVYRIREFSGNSTPTYTKYSETTYQYNQMDLLTSVTDGLNNVTTISYDHIGQKIGMVDPDMGAWSYAYDGAGNLTRQTDAKNQTICLYYDNIARLTGKHYRTDTSCPTSNPSLNVSFGYDSGTYGIGRRTSMSDPSGSTTWSYDLRGRLTQENRTISGSGTFVTQWGYDTLDRPSWIKYPGGNASQVGEQVTYTYHDNVASWLVSVVGASTYAKNIAYDVAGRIDLLSLGGSGSNPVLNVDYVYNAWTTQGGRLQQTKTGTPANATSLQDLRYTYDNAGNVLTIQDYKAGSPQTQTFGYDFLNRLTSAQASGGTGGTYALENYVFNQIGNLTNKGTAGISYPASTPGGCAAGTPATKPHAASGSTSNPSTNTYSYDCNGNITTRIIGGTTYSLAYDQENRLTGVSGGTTASFVYNGDGERVKGTAGGVTTVYVGSHYEVAGSTVKKYYYAGSLRIAMNDGGTLKFLMGDHLGSTSIVANGTTGAKISEVRYKPWGENRYTSGTTPTTYRYTGQRQESSLGGSDGLYFYNARWYDSAIGRFVSPDSIITSPSNPQTFNRYSYSLSNPINYTDPTGHSPNPSCSGNPTPDCGVDNTPAPPAPIVPGYRATLIAPGTGQVTMYNYPVYNDESLSRPEDLDPTQQKAGRLQGSVKINGQNWNYICTGGDNCPSGYWQENDFPCAYASATQCLTPLNSRAPNRTTGAAQTNATGRIPVSSTQLIIIQAPGAPASSPFQRPVIIKSQDGCPGCDPLQVDIFSPHETIQSLNTRNGLNTPVYIWRLDVIVPSNDIYDWGRGGVR